MARAAINILGDGSILDITSLGKSNLTVDHPGPGQYSIRGTLGMCPPPEGWGYVINQMDTGALVTTSYADGVLAVSVVKDGEPADLLHSITLHVAVEELPPIALPPVSEPSPPDPLEFAREDLAKRRAAADYAIAPLQDASDLDEATDAELASLKAWKKYRVLLSRVPEQPSYPDTIDWPALPA